MLRTQAHLYQRDILINLMCNYTFSKIYFLIFISGIMCELVDLESGEMMQGETLIDFARNNGIKCISILDLVRYRLNTEA